MCAPVSACSFRRCRAQRHGNENRDDCGDQNGEAIAVCVQVRCEQSAKVPCCMEWSVEGRNPLISLVPVATSCNTKTAEERSDNGQKRLFARYLEWRARRIQLPTLGIQIRYSILADPSLGAGGGPPDANQNREFLNVQSLR